MHIFQFPEEIKEGYKFAIQKAREDRPTYLQWIKDEIQKAIDLINSFDKVYVLGGLGARQIKAAPTFYNQFLANYNGPDKDKIQDDELLQPDDHIEVILEYAISIATSTPNLQQDVIPTVEDIDKIYEQLATVFTNITFYELSAQNPTDGNEFDHWLRFHMMSETIHVRGAGYQLHIQEVFQEVFAPHNTFIASRYGFDAADIFATIVKLDRLVYSKIGNMLGATMSHERLMEWMEEVGQENSMRIMVETGKHFMQQFVEANPDLGDEANPEGPTMLPLDYVEGYNRLFWVIPKTNKEKLIFEKLSIQFGENPSFLEPPQFKCFPLNDTLIKVKPLVQDGGRFYHFSSTLAFRNIFEIVENLINDVDPNYYKNTFKGNSKAISRDNYLETKVIQVFQKLLPNVAFYHSLKYTVTEDSQTKRTELDILGVSTDAIYIIEVKAGELSQKHRRGAMKGLKDRLIETINEGSYQCRRAEKYIQENNIASFDYVDGGTGKSLTIDKSKNPTFFKISVTLEHFSSISANLKYLINSGILNSDYKWAWIVSLYDLMIFADLIESENDFKDYMTNRMALYERNDVEFSDEIDILGYFLEGNFPLGPEKEGEMLQIVEYREKIEAFYNNSGLGLPGAKKPKRQNNATVAVATKKKKNSSKRKPKSQKQRRPKKRKKK